MIRVQNLCRSFGLKKVLNSISFNAELGETIEICGDNGTGKTTLLKTLAGILLPSEGSVNICGFDTKREFIKAKEQLGYVGVSDGGFFTRLTGHENLALLSEFFGLEQEIFDSKLRALEDKLEIRQLLNTPYNEMSSGMKQFLRIALALLKPHKILLLDEPLRSLDKKKRANLINLLAEENKARLLVVTNHLDQEWQAFRPRSFRLENGKLLQ